MDLLTLARTDKEVVNSGKGRNVPSEVLFGILVFERLVATLISAKACIR